MTHAVLYRWRIKPGCEDDFVAAWGRLTDVMREKCGALGSRLHRAEDGTLMAYARWPSKAVWSAAKENPPKSAARALMSAAIAERFPETHLDIVADLLGQGSDEG